MELKYKRISKEKYDKMLEMFEDQGRCEPRGLFYLLDADVIVGIDNTAGDLWVECFYSIEECEFWFKGSGDDALFYNEEKAIREKLDAAGGYFEHKDNGDYLVKFDDDPDVEIICESKEELLTSSIYTFYTEKEVNYEI